ncbi:MAG: ATP-grasp domain-containing protein, partial [Candidatus Diapherotrites archaeon]|nr:ATP-grasp domain-containing protein [Candidatus Diapherotrites archaeon]
VLVRPSYVLSGSAMNTAFDDKSLGKYLKDATNVSKEHPVVISKFISNAHEIEFDGVANKGELVIYAITEHVENAGVHSGDATIVLPGQKMYLETTNRVKEVSKKIAKELQITGPFNIQFLAKDNRVRVIECNLRASRSFPFCSKVVGKNFIDLSTKAIMQKKLPAEIDFFGKLKHVGVKAPMFSFNRLKGADPMLGVEMASTGEVACIGSNFYDALLKSMLSTGIKLPEKNVYISIGGEENKHKFVHQAKKLQELGFNIFASQHTSEFLSSINVKNKMLYKVHENKEPNILTYLQNKKIDFVLYVPNQYKPIEQDDSYKVRRTAVDYGIPLITNLQLAKAFIKAISLTSMDELEIKSWNETMQENSVWVKEQEDLLK